MRINYRIGRRIAAGGAVIAVVVQSVLLKKRKDTNTKGR